MIEGDGRWWRVQAQHLREMRKSVPHAAGLAAELDGHLKAAHDISLVLARSKAAGLAQDYPE